MAKQEECTKCKWLKQGGYASEIKCSFYGRKPVYDDSPCPNFPKCPECGQEVPKSAKICPNCGYPLREVVVPNKKTQSEVSSKAGNSTSQKSSSKVLLLVLVILAVVAGIVFVANDISSTNAEAARLEKEKKEALEQVRLEKERLEQEREKQERIEQQQRIEQEREKRRIKQEATKIIHIEHDMDGLSFSDFFRSGVGNTNYIHPAPGGEMATEYIMVPEGKQWILKEIKQKDIYSNWTYFIERSHNKKVWLRRGLILAENFRLYYTPMSGHPTIHLEFEEKPL